MKATELIAKQLHLRGPRGGVPRSFHLEVNDKRKGNYKVKTRASYREPDERILHPHSIVGTFYAYKAEDITSCTLVMDGMFLDRKVFKPICVASGDSIRFEYGINQCVNMNSALFYLADEPICGCIKLKDIKRI